jgi:hypothetical protein
MKGLEFSSVDFSQSVGFASDHFSLALNNRKNAGNAPGNNGTPPSRFGNESVIEPLPQPLSGNGAFGRGTGRSSAR